MHPHPWGVIVSSLATADALTKLLIEKGLISETEFIQKLLSERAVYQDMLEKLRYRHGMPTLTSVVELSD